MFCPFLPSHLSDDHTVDLSAWMYSSCICAPTSRMQVWLETLRIRRISRDGSPNFTGAESASRVSDNSASVQDPSPLPAPVPVLVPPVLLPAPTLVPVPPPEPNGG